jgi:DnaJ-domain-containing protein 1
MLKLILFLAILGIGYLMAQRFLTSSGPMSTDEACRLLGVAADADRETINAAHRQLIAKVHPDSGGNTELASRVNMARDVLLRRITP